MLLHGLPKYLIQRVQKVQNSAARVIAMIPKREPITPYLADLHWLPVQQRVEYKVLLYTYKALNNISPQYISDLLDPYKPKRSLRSETQNRLEPPPRSARYVAYGGRSFKHAAPALWNTIPDDLRNACSLPLDSFKRKLKTYLFSKAYF